MVGLDTESELLKNCLFKYQARLQVKLMKSPLR